MLALLNSLVDWSQVLAAEVSTLDLDTLTVGSACLVYQVRKLLRAFLQRPVSSHLVLANLAGPRLINRHSVPELTDPAIVVSPPRRLVSSLPLITLNRQHRSLIGYEEPRGWLGGRLDRKTVAQQLRAQQCVENYGAPSPLGIPQSETELPVAPCKTRDMDLSPRSQCLAINARPAWRVKRYLHQEELKSHMGWLSPPSLT
ncbi:putative low-specificity L-threonine aldolase [Fusarium oxysporum f. sp. albedinis]|nr:putative low-specificity L-threonine aldolase [Fusarium oxysporum f. sp. albedinis]